jgi:hypothetical protein
MLSPKAAIAVLAIVCAGGFYYQSTRIKALEESLMVTDVMVIQLSMAILNMNQEEAKPKVKPNSVKPLDI